MSKLAKNLVTAKLAAASGAIRFVDSGMILGLGTGSTANTFLELLSKKVSTGELEIKGVATSSATLKYANKLKIPMIDIEKVDEIDLVIDGADEFDDHLNLIKGGGGALLKEKIVAKASKRMVVIADSTKQVKTLGSFPLPVEIVKFGIKSTIFWIHSLLNDLGYRNFTVSLRRNISEFFISDENHYIVDLTLGEINDAKTLETRLLGIPGVVDTGFFLEMAKTVVIGAEDGTYKIIGLKTL